MKTIVASGDKLPVSLLVTRCVLAVTIFCDYHDKLVWVVIIMNYGLWFIKLNIALLEPDRLSTALYNCK